MHCKPGQSQSPGQISIFRLFYNISGPARSTYVIDLVLLSHNNSHPELGRLPLCHLQAKGIVGWGRQRGKRAQILTSFQAASCAP